jgi:hypothetical protein
MSYQPRWLAYARAHGKNPADGELENWHFVNWIRERWAQWDALTGHHGMGRPKSDHAAFDAWLSEWVGALPEPVVGQQELPL